MSCSTPRDWCGWLLPAVVQPAFRSAFVAATPVRTRETKGENGPDTRPKGSHTVRGISLLGESFGG